jgi:hypothetical protein
MIIFKRQRMHPALMISAPAGSLVDCSESGYINSNQFVKWLKHFIEHVKSTTEKKVMLVLDGHSTYSKNWETIKIAGENGCLVTWPQYTPPPASRCNYLQNLPDIL